MQVHSLHEARRTQGQQPGGDPGLWVPTGGDQGHLACAGPSLASGIWAARSVIFFRPLVQVLQVGPWRRNWQGGGR